MATDYVINPDRFQNFFKELETRKTLLTTITQLHKTITTHFTSIEQSLLQKSQTLDSKIEAFETQTKKSLESLDIRENSIPEIESNAAARVEEKRESAVAEIESPEEVVVVGGGGVEKKLLSEMLKVYCGRMDSGGLVRLLLAKRRESVSLRSDITGAMKVAVDSMRLVVDAVEEFVDMKVEGKVGVADRRWACGMLIQAVVPVAEIGGGVGASLRERAAGVLERWKGVIGGGDGGGGGGGGMGAGEASMFLQMVVGFGLKGKFEEEFLRKLVVEFAARRDMGRLAVALGFGDNMGDIIDGLVKSGKEIEAVYFACESGLTERFPPVSLLKTYLRNCRKNANNISKNGKFSSIAVEEANNSELNATRAIIKCVEDHKLESEFPLDSLRKRVTQLEKARSEKKKTSASTSKPSNKRSQGGGSRGSGGGPSFRPPKSGRFSNASPSLRHRNPSQSNRAPAARFSGAYNYPNPSVYEGPGAASYGSGYGGVHSQSPAALPQQYSYAAQDAPASGVRAGITYGGPGAYAAQTNYSAYDYGAAGAASYPPSYPQV